MAKFLIIDDSPDDRELIARTLKKTVSFRNAEVREAEHVEHGRRELEGGEIDCLLLDFSMPGESGLDFLVDIQLRFPELPVVMITGEGNERTAVDALKSGALDYIVKADISPDSLEQAIGKAIEKKHQEVEIIRHAHYDELTGLPNRRALFNRLQYLEGRAPRGVPPYAIVFMDLDGLKQVNDAMGHEIGDRLIKEVAEQLRVCVREGDLVARIGGDEFVAILENLTGDGIKDSDIATARFRESIDRHLFDFDGKVVNAGMSVGYAIYPTSSKSRSDLLAIADKAMYADKQARKELAKKAN
ncbi:diguanylate cyclase [Hwanghaeella grinnelliae]|uniref:Diguanylate cyclase n=1 Tax=Hwanghaeella grinnelliae TaxID=2500179 RepID=A0A3S2Z990_9PROT|nr:diguanylate cyclase [Hwanghaeella grinnelliae]RVU36594.1 diguanylate cyclase [Hwanghaeella grinnelliae]